MTMMMIETEADSIEETIEKPPKGNSPLLKTRNVKTHEKGKVRKKRGRKERSSKLTRFEAEKKPKYKLTPKLSGPLLRRAEAMSYTQLRDTMFDELIRHGRFPKPIKISDTVRAVGWLRSELDAWLESRRVARDRKGEAA